MKEFWREFNILIYYMNKSCKNRVNKKSKRLTTNLRRKLNKKENRKQK